MSATREDIFVLAGAIVTLAMVAFVVAKGDKTSKIIKSIIGDSTSGFIGAIRAATGQGKGGFA